MDLSALNAFIEMAIYEDVRDGDHTSLACIPPDATGKAKLLVKEEGIIAGVEVAKKIFDKFDDELEVFVNIHDGEEIKFGDIIFTVEGKKLSILQTERVVLNVMQRMSGIATNTKKFVEKVKGLNTIILDTRKTSPGMRFIEKAAVRIGGGHNHRMGLFDMVLIKDNHIDFSGGIGNAILKTKKYLSERNLKLKIEVEARNLDEIRQILDLGGIDRILLDNLSVEETAKAVALIDREYETETSGNITLDTVRAYAECGVDYISVGALTNQFKSLDLSLKAM